MAGRRLIIAAFVGLIAVPLGVTGAKLVESGISLRQSEIGRKQIADYVRTHAVRKLQIGAGGVAGFSDWLNTDIEPQRGEAYLDATKPFPVANGTFSYVFSEHLFEHLSYSDGLEMLRACHRAIKPGGKIRISTPNLLKLAQLFQESKTAEMQSYIHTKVGSWPQTISPECVIMNYELKSFGHQFVYDPRTLRESLDRAGFRDIREFAPGESDDPQLRDLEVRHKVADHAANDYETMVFQATQ